MPVSTTSTLGTDLFKNAVGKAFAKYTMGGGPIENLERFAGDELQNLAGERSSTFLEGIMDTANRVGQEPAVAKARADADKASNVTEGIFQRRTEGMSLSGRQKMAAKQQLSLNREVSKAAASYNTRNSFANASRQANQALSGFENIAFGQMGAGLTGLANAEGQRQVRLANERASKKAKRNSLIGTAIGIVGAIFGSSEEFKAPIEKAPNLLDKLSKVRVDKWKYHGGDRNHIGPYAEEFNKTFGVGKDHQKYLDVVDVLGVTLGAVKELNEKVEARG